MRPVYVDININNLNNNLNLIRNFCVKKKIWLVLKSNAYGHGLKNIYCNLFGSIDGLAVLNVSEALFLRNLGFTKSILLLGGFFDLEELKLCVEYNFIIVVYNVTQISLIKKLSFTEKLSIYLKFNFNLNRLGFNFKEIKKNFYILQSINNVQYISLILHFSNSDKFVNFNEVFHRYKSLIDLSLLRFKNISLFSSAGIIWHLNDLNNDWVRAGIILYGSSPTNNYSDIINYGFKPVMTFRSEIICIQKVKCGQTIGYGNNYISDRNRLIGIVACGYADGYPRQLSNNSFVLIDNCFKCHVIAVVMDMMMVDLLDNKDVYVGSKVELWGGNICIDTIAKLANTVNYHLMCSINHSRVNFKLVNI